MSAQEVTYTDETCVRCGAGLIRLEPDDADEACVYCPPDQGCGMVDRYEEVDSQ